MTTILNHTEGQVLITTQTDGRNLVIARLHDAKTFSPRTEFVTSYPAGIAIVPDLSLAFQKKLSRED